MKHAHFDLIAKIVSFIFYPLFTFPLIIAIGVREMVQPEMVTRVLLLALSLGIIPIVLFLVYLRAKGKVSDWDIRKREERTPINVSGLLLGIILILIMWQMKVGPFVRYLFALMTGMGVFTLITLKWKISGHSAGATLLSLLATYYYGIPALIAAITIVFVAWSRVRLNNHTWQQTVGGILLSACLFIVLFKLHLIS